MLFARGLLSVSGPCIFTVLNLKELQVPLASIELESSAQFSVMLSWTWHLLQIEWQAI